MHTILGAGGVIADGLAIELVQKNMKTRLVSRNPTFSPKAELFKADMTDLKQAMQAIRNSSVVYLCIGLKYDYAVWREQWPKIMNNVIEACGQCQAKLIFFDNVYMYGKVDGVMTEELPYNPSSRKGDLRARIATQLMSAVRKGNITASIARAADFYGPGAGKSGIPNLLVLSNLIKQKKAQWLANPTVKHSFTYTPDAIKALALLGLDDQSWNQTWHLPTSANPLTGKEFIHLMAEALKTNSQLRVLKPWMIRIAGLFDKTISEIYEMLYQYQYDYIFDSSKFEKAFDFQPTTYQQGILETVADLVKNR
jgi:nucleoside-diphosphate-sugar epimerase